MKTKVLAILALCFLSIMAFQLLSSPPEESSLTELKRDNLEEESLAKLIKNDEPQKKIVNKGNHISADQEEETMTLSEQEKKKILESKTSKKDQLFSAVETNEIEKARFLIESGANLEEKDEYGNTALLKSMDEGHLGMAKLLLKNGANPHVVNDSGLSVATAAALQFEGDLFKELVQKGAKVNPKVLGNMNLLMSLSMEGQDEIVSFIIETKPEEINLQDEFGNTALHYAVQGGHETVVRELHTHAAKSGIRNSEGLSPLEMAKKDGNKRIISILGE